MNIIAIIPARMGSSRFPGKPMTNIHGMPMVGHVFHRTRMCPLVSETYVATCDEEIYDYVSQNSGQAIMTADTHERCTDRTAEAMLKVEQITKKKVDVIVMVQGDEPMVAPDMIEQSIKPLIEDKSVNVVNLMAKMKTVVEFEDPNEVKVVVDLDGNALYFSREPIPTMKKDVKDVPMIKQVCIIPFRRDYLLRFNAMQETPLEKIESVDMMRIIEHGEKVRMVMIENETLSVDTLADKKRVVEMMREDALMKKYII